MQSRFSTLALATVVGASALVSPFSLPRSQDQDLAARVSTLEAVVLQQQVDLQEAQDEIDRLNGITDVLVKACGNLERAMASSRKNGFEWAGANPQAKTDLLDGIREFARQVRIASGAPDALDDGDGDR